MKRLLALIIVALVCVGFTTRREKPYLIAFDLTSRDSLDQKAVMRWVKEVTTASPDAKIEVVMYGKGFELVLPERSTVPAEVQEAIRNPNVSFRVCAVALRNNNVNKAQLFPGVETVPDGLRELVTKQQEGWGYIKVGH